MTNLTGVGFVDGPEIVVHVRDQVLGESEVEFDAVKVYPEGIYGERVRNGRRHVVFIPYSNVKEIRQSETLES